jgi:hypothetical protein
VQVIPPLIFSPIEEFTFITVPGPIGYTGAPIPELFFGLNPGITTSIASCPLGCLSIEATAPGIVRACSFVVK